ncbi:MAG TPA: dihydrolipoamide acetyltransferase family protein [Gammaproteobacteria bacterium]|nr:dihydrolipoamide acetyltransferase family protein [Gammaproteobacteria bacterium]
MTVFKLPDLGEGLQEAEIAAWHVAPDDEVAVDQPLLAVETAKAIVEIPSPRAGKIKRLFGKSGDMLEVGAPLVEFVGADDADAAKPAPRDAGTVVGRVEKGNEIARERATPAGRAGAAAVKATPAVRALARRLEVDLAVVTPSGPNDTVTARDVERVARIFRELGPLEPLRGVRRTMARSMAQAHAEVAPVTVNDDADLAAWWPASSELMLRLIRAIAAGCKAEPALNAWFDSRALGRRVLPQIHLGIAVDTPDGLFVPVLRDIGGRSADDLRAGLERLRRDTRARTIPPEEMRGYTFTLSNFGTFGGRYANPIVQPPTVGILGAGRVRDEVVAVDGVPAVHPLLPLSLTFDHRAVTGGEATRFLAAVIHDLAAVTER